MIPYAAKVAPDVISQFAAHPKPSFGLEMTDLIYLMRFRWMPLIAPWCARSVRLSYGARCRPRGQTPAGLSGGLRDNQKHPKA